MGVPFNGMTTFAVVEDGSTFDLDVFSIAAWVTMYQMDGSQLQLFVDGPLVAVTEVVGRMPRSDAPLYASHTTPHMPRPSACGHCGSPDACFMGLFAASLCPE